jgi:hypothetical protein
MFTAFSTSIELTSLTISNEGMPAGYPDGVKGEDFWGERGWGTAF